MTPMFRMTVPPSNDRHTALLLSKSTKSPMNFMTCQWKIEKQRATPDPKSPMAAPVNTSEGCDSIFCAFVKIQIGAAGRPLQKIASNIASTKCSKYSTPNREQTSKAKMESPSGTPKNADKAPDIPINICLCTSFLNRCRKIVLDTKPPRGPGPRDPPPTMQYILATSMGMT